MAYGGFGWEESCVVVLKIMVHFFKSLKQYFISLKIMKKFALVQ